MKTNTHIKVLLFWITLCAAFGLIVNFNPILRKEMHGSSTEIAIVIGLTGALLIGFSWLASSYGKKILRYLQQVSYQKYLVLWLAVGTLITGFFYINPEASVHKEEHYYSFGISPNRTVYQSVFYNDIEKDDYYQGYILITIVGAILIGGLGYAGDKKKE